jgi:hypothetical protein
MIAAVSRPMSENRCMFCKQHKQVVSATGGSTRYDATPVCGCTAAVHSGVWQAMIAAQQASAWALKLLGEALTPEQSCCL